MSKLGLPIFVCCIEKACFKFGQDRGVQESLITVFIQKARTLPSYFCGAKLDIACARGGIGAVDMHLAVFILACKDRPRAEGRRGAQWFAARRDLIPEWIPGKGIVPPAGGAEVVPVVRPCQHERSDVRGLVLDWTAQT